MPDNKKNADSRNKSSPAGNSDERALLNASKNGNLKIVKELCAKGVNVNAAETKDGYTALMWASQEGHLEIVRELCERGANVNAATTDDGSTALVWASQNGHLEIVRELCRKGANVNAATTNDGYTALMSASEEGHLGIVRELCERGANVNAATTNDGFTALMWASDNGHLEVVRELCERGANVNAARTDDGYTVLMFASDNGHLEVVRELFERGANVNATRTDNGSTALMRASVEGHLEVVKELCRKGANVNAATTDDGATALMWASQKGNVPIITALLDKQARIDDIDKFGRTALMYASKDGNSGAVKFLCEAGANVNVVGAKDGFTALIFACREGHLEIVKELCRKGADVNAATKKDDFTPLMLACHKGNLEMVKELCRKGAKVNAAALRMARTEEIRTYLTSLSEPWKGFTQSDMTKLDTIFEENAINYSTCPVCLEYVERSEACMYMKHNCSKGPYYHKEIYERFESDGFTTWCTICGRICHGHRHYKLTAFGTKPDLEKAGDPFAKDCSSQGGGGLNEKLSRFRRLREYALELEEDVDKKSKLDAMNELVEEMWNAPLRRDKVLKKIMNEKKWNNRTKNELFRRNTMTTTNENAPNIPFEGERPIQKVGRNNVMMNDDVDIFSFRHKQKNGSIEEHGIGEEALEGFLESKVKEFGTPEFGYCFMHPGCDAKLHPEEVRDAVPEELYKDYKKKFNKKFRAQAGGGGIFREATDAVCVVKRRNNATRKSKNKRGGSRRV